MNIGAESTGINSTPDFPRSITFIAATLVFVMLGGMTLGAAPLYWYSDDAMVVYLLGEEPWTSFFCSQEVIRSFGAGSLTPFLAVSLKVDLYLSGVNPIFFYLRSLVSTVFAGLALLVLLFRITRDEPTSVALAIAWFFSAPVGSVLHFISARHYMEGLLFGILAVLFCWRLFTSRELPDPTNLLLAMASLHVSILCKEIMLVLYPLFFVTAVYRRHWWLAAFITFSGMLYLIYRFWALGISMDYGGIRLPGVMEVLNFLLKTPYYLSGHWSSMALLPFILAALWTSPRMDRSRQLMLILVSLILLISFGIIYPVMEAIRIEWHTPGPWYRAVLMTSTLILIGIAVVIGAHPQRRRIGLGVAVAVVMVPGYLVTMMAWKQEKNKYHAEAMAYLRHEDKVIISQLPAYWYLPGVHLLTYGREDIRFQPSRDDPQIPSYLYMTPEKLEQFGRAYIVVNGELVESIEGYMDALSFSRSRHSESPAQTD